jgi:hypothetical protein
MMHLRRIGAVIACTLCSEIPSPANGARLRYRCCGVTGANAWVNT